MLLVASYSAIRARKYTAWGQCLNFSSFSVSLSLGDLKSMGPIYPEFLLAISKEVYMILRIFVSKLSFCKENRIFEETLSYIKNNILSINSNEEIAQFMNYHSYYLNKIFKEKTGTSMHRYIINERLKIAADLLITTSHNVNEVAKLSGFENSRHFSTAFMKKYKCTPSSMRKRSKTFI